MDAIIDSLKFSKSSGNINAKPVIRLTTQAKITSGKSLDILFFIKSKYSNSSLLIPRNTLGTNKNPLITKNKSTPR